MGSRRRSTRLKYEYKQLNDGEFCILKLLPAKEKADELRAELQCYTLSTDVDYEAVSYVWGEPIFTLPLRIGSYYIYITENLSSALRHFRGYHKPRTLWVDAACIDQSNAAEKNVQVPIMGQIFQHAETVLAWLGELPNAQIDEEAISFAGHVAFEHLDHLRLTSIEAREEAEQVIKELKDKDVIDDWSMTWCLCDMDEELNPGGMRALWQSSWFTRIWIVQEAALARKLEFHYGSGYLDWIDFERMCWLLLAFPYREDAWYRFSKNCWRVVSARNGFKHQPSVNLWCKMIASLGSQACLQDVDYVYALVGLLPKNSAASLTVDYGKHPYAVYTEAATIAIKFKELRILYTAGAWRRSSWNRQGSRISYDLEKESRDCAPNRDISRDRYATQRKSRQLRKVSSPVSA